MGAVFAARGQYVRQPHVAIARFASGISPYVLREPARPQRHAYRVFAGLQIAAHVVFYIIHAVAQLLGKRLAAYREFALAVVGRDRREYIARYARAVYVQFKEAQTAYADLGTGCFAVDFNNLAHIWRGAFGVRPNPLRIFEHFCKCHDKSHLS